MFDMYAWGIYVSQYHLNTIIMNVMEGCVPIEAKKEVTAEVRTQQEANFSKCHMSMAKGLLHCRT